MKIKGLKQLFPGIGISLAVAAVSFFSPDLFRSIDNDLLTIQYRLRGEEAIDSSIAILYIDNDDISALGGWPLRRSYYALMLDALSGVGVSAVGIDIAFTEPDIHGAGYDDLLAEVIERSGNVVLGGYFRSLSSEGADTAAAPSDTLPERFYFRSCGPFNLPQGRKLGVPIGKISNAAAGFGHTSLGPNFEIPLLVDAGSGRYVVSFAYAVYSMGQMRKERETKEMNAIGGIPGSDNGNVSVNYAGGVNSLPMYSAVDFLKSYTLAGSGGGVGPADRNLRNKIVFIAVVAEGRSKFIDTPFSDGFPAIGIHATFVHNALRNNFLSRAPSAVQHILVFLTGLFCSLAFRMKREIAGVACVAALFIVFMSVSFALFSYLYFVVPVAFALATGIAVTAVSFAYRHKAIREHAGILLLEKEKIAELLRKNEIKLRALEEQLVSYGRQRGKERSAELENEVIKYRSEVDRLKKIADDFQISPPIINGDNSRQEFSGIIYGGGGPMAEIVGMIKKIADNKATVLLLGESGTGKELVARALHEHSGRKNKPFVAVNCGALSETLLESELFGHEKGAFTGAVKERAGRFEIADTGTIFLDEIAETSESFQVKLLRVLQDGTYERVGGTKTGNTDVRVIAATNKDLPRLVTENKFREDLFYRLNAFTIKIPPLRERREDIPWLVDYFIRLEDAGMRSSVSVMESLKQNEWKGNVREIQSLIKRAVLLARADGRDMLRLKDFPVEIAQRPGRPAEAENQIVQIIREKNFSRNSISEAADDLGMSRGTIAEYFRGYCFKCFVESRFDILSAAHTVARSAGDEVENRVENKLREYIGNATELIDRSRSVDENIAVSKPKYKNLPQRYHRFLDEIIASACRNEWSLTPRSGGKQPPSA